jgi:hypothetical protein
VRSKIVPPPTSSRGLTVRLLGLAAVSIVACSASDADRTPDCDGVELLVAANSTDFLSSVVCGAPGSCTSGVDLGGDPVLATSSGRAFFVSRDKDLLFELDPACGTPSRPISVHALARQDPKNGRLMPANPHDLAATPDGTLVVPLYNVGRVAFVKDGVVDSLDISQYDEDDGNPQAESVRVVMIDGAAKAFVAIERLDDHHGLRSTRGSQMLRIDVAKREVEAVIDLAGRNPFNTMAELGSALFLAVPGSFDATDETRAGIERFDAATSQTALLVEERALGGSVAEIAVTDGCGAAIVAGPRPNVTSVVTFDPTSGRVLTTAQAPAFGPTQGYDLFGLAWRGRTLYVGDRRPRPGGYPVHVLERAEGCRLIDTERTIALERAPLALRAAEPPQRR